MVEIMDHEIGRVERRDRAARAVGLRRARQVEPGLGEEIMFQHEALLIDFHGGTANWAPST